MGNRSVSLAGEVVEIRGENVFVRRGDTVLTRIGLQELIHQIYLHQDVCLFSDGSPIPNGVRFVRRRGKGTVVVLELPPQVRKVQWISHISKKRYGMGTHYDDVTLAFPYIVIIVLFIEGKMSGYQQLYYRTQALNALEDPLYQCNLLNVSDGVHGKQKSWVCLVAMQDITHLPWGRKVQSIIDHFWSSGFNQSSDFHEGNSYWTKMVKAKLDPRVCSIEAWQNATAEDALFVLKVKWKPAKVTVKEVVDSMLSVAQPISPVRNGLDLANLVFASGPRIGSKLGSSHLMNLKQWVGHLIG